MAKEFVVRDTGPAIELRIAKDREAYRMAAEYLRVVGEQLSRPAKTVTGAVPKGAPKAMPKPAPKPQKPNLKTLALSILRDIGRGKPIYTKERQGGTISDLINRLKKTGYITVDRKGKRRLTGKGQAAVRKGSIELG